MRNPGNKIKKVKLWLKAKKFEKLWNKLCELSFNADQETKKFFINKIKEILPHSEEKDIDNATKNVKTQIKKLEENNKSRKKN